jgi:hypothetical protein
MKVHTENKVSNYTTILPNRMELEGEWEVAMVDFSYPVTWHNVSRGEWFKVVVDSYDLNAEGPVDVGEGEISISEGRYETPKELVDTIRSAWNDYWDRVKKELRNHGAPSDRKMTVPSGTRLTPIEQLYKQRADISVYPDVNQGSMIIHYNEKTNKVKFKMAYMTHHLVLSPKLCDILAIDNEYWTVPGPYWMQDNTKTYESESEIDIHRGCHTLFVYCSIVQDSIVGDVRAPLLRAVTARGKSGATTHETFTRPLYVPLKRNSFDTIDVSIKSEDGTFVPFAYGNSYVTLHFRRVAP